MAGVVQEIDLILSQSSLKTLEADLATASQKLGSGLASGASKGATDFARNLITTLQQRLAAESGVLAKQLADGTLSPAQYTAASQRLGKEIAADIRKGITSGGKLDLFGGEGGIALRNQLQGIGVAATQAVQPVQRAAAAVTAIGAAASRTPPILNGVRSALTALASQAIGVPGPLGRIASLLLQFSSGGLLAVGAVATIGLIALAINKLQAAAEKGRKATDDFLTSIKNLGKSEFDLLSEKIDTANKLIAETEKRIKSARDLASLSATGSVVINSKQLQEEQARLEELGKGLKALRQEQAVSKSDEAVEWLKNYYKAEEDKAKEAAERRKKWLKELKDNLEAARKAQEELTGEFNAFWDDIEARANLASPMVVARIKEMQVASREAFDKAFGKEVQDNFDRVNQNLDLIEKGLNEIGAGNKVFSDIKRQVEDTRTPTEKLHDGISEITGALDNLLSRNGIALLGEQATQSLGSILNLADSIGNLRDKLGNLTVGGVVGVASAGIGVITSIAGAFNRDKDPGRLRTNQEMYENAIQGDPAALEFLRIHSVVSHGGRPGWGSEEAARDASQKYQQALQILTGQGAPQIAASAAAAAAAAQRQTVIEREQAEVERRTEAERTGRVQGLITEGTGFGGPIREAADRLRRLEEEFKHIIATSGAGEDSPLARHTRQQADEAARELERAIEDAKRERERATEEAQRAKEEVAPGFTVQRTITQSSAGEIVGNLVTANVWLEKIYGAVSGQPTVGAGVGGGAVTVPVQVFLDGKMIADAVGTRQYRNWQNQAGLNGNAGMT